LRDRRPVASYLNQSSLDVLERSPGDLSILVLWYTTGMRMTRSARRHGVRDEAIRHAVTNAIRLVDTDDGVFVIGADASGQMLELVARPTEDGDLVVFHAMPLRPVNAKRYLS
jgi:hypothetical protein